MCIRDRRKGDLLRTTNPRPRFVCVTGFAGIELKGDVLLRPEQQIPHNIVADAGGRDGIDAEIHVENERSIIPVSYTHLRRAAGCSKRT